MVMLTKLDGVKDCWGGCRFTYDSALVAEIRTLLRVNRGDKTKVFEIVWEDSERPDIQALPREGASQVLRLIDNIASEKNL